MDRLTEMEAFATVVDQGGFTDAAKKMGISKSAVSKHVSSLEARLGVKLFQRHARGYTPTEAGADLLQVAQATDDQFAQLAGRIKGQGQGVSGELVVTSVPTMAKLVTPVLAKLQAEHPELRVRYLTDERLFRLEYGEAHVAIRSGPAPDQPDIEEIEGGVKPQIGGVQQTPFGTVAGAAEYAETGPCSSLQIELFDRPRAKLGIAEHISSPLIKVSRNLDEDNIGNPS